METIIEQAVDATPEQLKRAELLEVYEKEIAPDRDARNAAIDAHENEFSDKWAVLQGDIAKVRSDVSDKLAVDNVPQKQRDQVLAMETAKLVEQHETAKHEAAVKLSKELPKVKKWVDFLEEKSVGGDPAVLNLLEEAKKSPDASLSGECDGKPRPIVLADLTFKADKDGVRYLRGKDEIIADRGHRLDVKRLDDRDIQAALQIASQKFDMDKGLVLSGDMAFRTRSAELAGRMGLKVQNMSPEMQKAWNRGQRSTAVLKQHERPNLSNGISGDVKKPEMVVLKIDPRLGTPEKMQTTGLDVRFGAAANEVLMNPEAYNRHNLPGSMDMTHLFSALGRDEVETPEQAQARESYRVDEMDAKQSGYSDKYLDALLEAQERMADAKEQLARGEIDQEAFDRVATMYGKPDVSGMNGLSDIDIRMGDFKPSHDSRVYVERGILTIDHDSQKVSFGSAKEMESAIAEYGLTTKDMRTAYAVEQKQAEARLEIDHSEAKDMNSWLGMAKDDQGELVNSQRDYGITAPEPEPEMDLGR